VRGRDGRCVADPTHRSTSPGSVFDLPHVREALARVERERDQHAQRAQTAEALLQRFRLAYQAWAADDDEGYDRLIDLCSALAAEIDESER
jgi:hypothetical protein